MKSAKIQSRFLRSRHEEGEEIKDKLFCEKMMDLLL